MTSYSFPLDQPDGTEVTLANGVTYQYDQANDRWLVKSTETLDEVMDERYVNRVGGDSMQGPLEMKKQPDTDSRDTNKIETLGVYSGSDSSALRLGTGEKSDRIYVGQNDTSFNGPIKVSDIQERQDGQGIGVEDSLIFDPRGHEIMRIRPEDGATHTITAFSNATSNGTKLDFKLYGNTYKNAIRFFAKSSAASQIAQISSDGGVNLWTTLDMNSNTIKEVADPVNPKDAVNKSYSDAQDALLEEHFQDEIDRLEGVVSEIADQFAIGKYRFKSGLVYPQEAGDMIGMRSNGSLTATVNVIAQLMLWESDYEGTRPSWESMRPGLLRFKEGARVISFDFTGATVDPDNGAVTLNVANGQISDASGSFQNNLVYLAFQPEASKTITTASLPLEHPQEVPDDVKGIVSGWNTQADANQTFVLADYTQQQEIKELFDATKFYFEDTAKVFKEHDERLDALEQNPSGGGENQNPQEVEEGHTMLGKGSWGNSKDQLSTNQFYGIDYQDRGRGVMDQYTYGLVFATNFANKYTPNYTFLPGAWVEVYDNNGTLVFAQEIDSMEVDNNNHLVIRWEYAPQIYRYQFTPSYGTSFFVKLHEVGDPTHVGGLRSVEKLAPPEGDPFVEHD